MAVIIVFIKGMARVTAGVIGVIRLITTPGGRVVVQNSQYSGGCAGTYE
jgi:hypothetical protein